MGILSWIIMGLIAGAIAKWIRPGADPSGCFITMIIGIVGGILGGWIGSLFGIGRINEFNFVNLLLAIGGSLIVLWLYAMIKKK